MPGLPLPLFHLFPELVEEEAPRRGGHDGTRRRDESWRIDGQLAIARAQAHRRRQESELVAAL